jgi:hypothetical protein
MRTHALFNEPEHPGIRVKKLNALNERPLQTSFDGKPDAGQVLWRARAPRALFIKEIGGDSDVAAAGASAFAITVDGVTFASAGWAPGATTAIGTITTAEIPQDSVIRLVAPASQDATLADGTISVIFGEG